MSTEPRGTKRRVEDLESRERDLDPEAPLEVRTSTRRETRLLTGMCDKLTLYNLL